MKFSRGQKFMMLAIFLFSVMGLLVKYLKNIPFHELVFFRAVIIGVGCGLSLHLRGRSLLGVHRKRLIFRGLAGTVGLLCYFYTIQAMPLASAVTLSFLSPIFTLVISSIFLKEKTKPLQWAFFMLAFAGVAMVKGFDPRISMLGLGVAVLGTLGSAVAYNLVRSLREKEDPLLIVFYFAITTLPIVGPYTAFNWVTPTGTELLLIVLMGLVTLVAQIFLTHAYHLERASNISHFMYFGAIFALLYGIFFFDETIPHLSLAGMGVLIMSVVMIGRYR